jgi:hypothetical protein
MDQGAGAHRRPIHQQLPMRIDVLSDAFEGSTRQLDAHPPAQSFGQLPPARKDRLRWS